MHKIWPNWLEQARALWSLTHTLISMAGEAPKPRLREVPCVLAIAGSDSGGGAGIQADLKACEALGVFGTTAVTALTAQNTVGVQAVHAVPASFVGEQMASVLGDFRVHAL